ncbi:MAG: MAPEG family protein [Pseudomonadota bacterium]
MDATPITAIYAAIFALIYVALSFNVIRLRRQLNVGLLDGGESSLARAIRAHGNFQEYVPLVLILMLITELNVYATVRIHATGMTLLLGRLLHGYALAVTTASPPARVLGMVLTFSAVIGSATNLLLLGLG